MKVEKITVDRAVQMFLSYDKELAKTGVSFSNMTYFVDESKSKMVDKKRVLQKLVSTNATIGSDYAKKVNRLLDKEGKEIDFVAQPMKGKEYVTIGKPVVRSLKTGEYQLVYIVEHHTKPDSQLYKNGKPVKREDVWNEEHITPANLNPEPQIAGRGLIEEENNFYFRTVGFNNLRAFKMNGCTYVIEG